MGWEWDAVAPCQRSCLLPTPTAYLCTDAKGPHPPPPHTHTHTCAQTHARTHACRAFLILRQAIVAEALWLLANGVQLNMQPCPWPFLRVWLGDPGLSPEASMGAMMQPRSSSRFRSILLVAMRWSTDSCNTFSPQSTRALESPTLTTVMSQ